MKVYTKFTISPNFSDQRLPLRVNLYYKHTKFFFVAMFDLKSHPNRGVIFGILWQTVFSDNIWQHGIFMLLADLSWFYPTSDTQMETKLINSNFEKTKKKSDGDEPQIVTKLKKIKIGTKLKILQNSKCNKN